MTAARRLKRSRFTARHSRMVEPKFRRRTTSHTSPARGDRGPAAPPDRQRVREGGAWWAWGGAWGQLVDLAGSVYLPRPARANVPTFIQGRYIGGHSALSLAGLGPTPEAECAVLGRSKEPGEV